MRKVYILLGLSFTALVLMSFMFVQLSLYPSPVPYGAEIIDTVTIYFSYKTTPERLFNSEMRPTEVYDYPIDRSNLPAKISLGGIDFKVTDTRQDSMGCSVEIEVAGKRYVLYLFRPSGITRPVRISESLLVYIIGAKVPDRAGLWYTAGSQHFYGFKSVTLALVRG